MIGTLTDRASRIETALGRAARDVRPLRAGCFSFTLAGSAGVHGRAALESDWIRLEVTARAYASPTLARRALALNRELTGAARCALPVTRRALLALADLPPEAGVGAPDPTCGIERALGDLADAASRLAGRNGRCSQPTASPESGEAVDELKRLLADSDWKTHDRDGSRLVADLRGRRDFFQAEIRDLGPAGVTLSAPIAKLDALCGASREAITLFLLEASGAARMARPLLHEADGRARPAFEVRLPPGPTLVELDHALCALVAACDTWGPEVKALADPEIANVFNAVRGWSSEREPERGGKADESDRPEGSQTARS